MTFFFFSCERGEACRASLRVRRPCGGPDDRHRGEQRTQRRGAGQRGADSVEDDGDGYPENMRHNGTPSFKSLNFNSGSTSLGLFFASSVAQLHSDGDRHGYIKLHNDGRLSGGVFEIWLP